MIWNEKGEWDIGRKGRKTLFIIYKKKMSVTTLLYYVIRNLNNVLSVAVDNRVEKNSQIPKWSGKSKRCRLVSSRTILKMSFFLITVERQIFILPNNMSATMADCQASAIGELSFFFSATNRRYLNGRPHLLFFDFHHPSIEPQMV